MLGITNKSLGSFGRFGNQLWQYAALKYVSLNHNIPIFLDKDLSDRVWHGQRCFLNEYNLEYSEFPADMYFVDMPEKSSFDERLDNLKVPVSLFGYYQNIKYLSYNKEKHGLRPYLQKEFSLKNSLITEKIIYELSKYTNPTSIHIRRGDNHSINNVGETYFQQVIDFVKDAISLFPKDTDFLVFTGGSRNGNSDRKDDFEFCKKHLSKDKVYFIEDNHEMIDFEIIKNCKNNIVSRNSTFSFWASYLNDESGDIIYRDFGGDSIFHNIYNDISWWRQI